MSITLNTGEEDYKIENDCVVSYKGKKYSLVDLLNGVSAGERKLEWTCWNEEECGGTFLMNVACSNCKAWMCPCNIRHTKNTKICFECGYWRCSCALGFFDSRKGKVHTEKSVMCNTCWLDRKSVVNL
jgi:uncharacterized protein YdeI (YjbR/CyaY-like superfamily)